MQMLHAGGYPCKGEPPAFECFEIGQIPWSECNGFAVKIVDAQLQLPPPGNYRVIRLRRNLIQQARSMNKWLGMLGLPAGQVSRIAGSYRRDYAVIDEWAAAHPTLVLDFEQIVTDKKRAAAAISAFAEMPLDIDRMASCVLERGPDCHPTVLELEILGNS